jgi:hypothetical protein
LTKDQRLCPPVLEEVAAYGSVATFELLRSKGAPLAGRPLHRAVETATFGYNTPGKGAGFGDHEERMSMVRYLLDVVGLDVNAPDSPEGPPFGHHHAFNGTPICYIPGSEMLERDTRELTSLLLDHGADPAPGLVLAQQLDYPKFIEEVEAWKAKQHEERRCCAQ